MAALARLVHALPGRKRLRIDEKRGDEAYFAAVEKALSDSPLVEAVETNSRTGSVLVHHQPAESSALQHAEEHGLFQLITEATQPVAAAPATSALPSVAANAVPTRKTSKSKQKATPTSGANLRPLIVMGWVALGIAQAIEGNIAIPAMAAFWYAYLAAQENGFGNAELG